MWPSGLGWRLRTHICEEIERIERRQMANVLLRAGRSGGWKPVPRGVATIHNTEE
jgi:hypothetical protein